MNVRKLYETGQLRPSRGFQRNYVTTQTIDPSHIQVWMTFSYVNYLFHLPPDYLVGSLDIQDSSYPDLLINDYINTHGLSAVDFLKQLQDAVVQYSNTPH
jgi:hypothetical protein